ncbi:MULTISPECIES: hypothetical protein [unclassified Cytobacillus]|uniref:hypothetical protein n=1 Tax=unclassified Cytobacillus TaxID=2675268 RepID=UPI00203D6CE7|nr:hypothetical protein [Cytobacillus sp. AMY 15.2]MCM3093158.1 hypothetical protein [Cytobacillus sp. AMY 15.2]
MFSFNTFKDLRYWILFFPYVLILIGFVVFSSGYPYAWLFVSLYAGVFWGHYHLWKYLDEKRMKNRK